MRLSSLDFVSICILFSYATGAVLQVKCANSTNSDCHLSHHHVGPVMQVEPDQKTVNKLILAESALNTLSFVLVDRRGPDRTVLFSDGYARDEVNFRLFLKPNETLQSVHSVANDTNILTSSTAEFSTRTLSDRGSMVNATVTHYFEGSVGSVSYVVTARTSRGHTFSAMGHYYVTGIVGASRNENGTTTVLTGIEAAAITFESPLDLSQQWEDNIIEIPIVYQPPGPDFYPDIQPVAQPNIQASNSAFESSSQSIADNTDLPLNSQSDEHSGGDSGEPSGNHSGEPSGNHSGEPSGNHSGEPSGNHSGGHVGEHSDEDSELESSMPPSAEEPFIQPDTPNSNQELSLEHIMSETRVEVGGHTVGSESNIVDWDPSQCTTVVGVYVDADGEFQFENTACGIGFDKENGRLLVRVRPGQSGFANIVLTAPSLIMNGEVSETSVHIIVREPPRIAPKLILFEDRVLKLDHFGKEVFVLHMLDTIAPPQAQNATDYIVDLPNGRYARANLHVSQLSLNMQDITFETQRVGEEDVSILKRLSSSALQNGVSRKIVNTVQSYKLRSKIVSDRSKTTQSILGVASFRGWFFGSGSEDQTIDRSFPENSPTTDLEEMEEPTEEPTTEPTELTESDSDTSKFESHVFVKFPSLKIYEMAENVNGRTLETEFAPATLAQPTTAPIDTSREYVVVSLVLYKYAAHNFSEHKANQLGRAVARQVEIASGVAYSLPKPMRMTSSSEMVGVVRDENKTETKAYLTRVRERATSIVVTYRSAVLARNGSQIATNLTIQENGIAEQIATEAMLPPGTVAVYDARILPTLGEDNFSGAGAGLPNLAGATAGVVIAAIVGLALIVTLPLVVLLFGFVVSRRNGDPPADTLGEEASTPPASGTAAREGPGTPFIERDETHRRTGDDM